MSQTCLRAIPSPRSPKRLGAGRSEHPQLEAAEPGINSIYVLSFDHGTQILNGVRLRDPPPTPHSAVTLAIAFSSSHLLPPHTHVREEHPFPRTCRRCGRRRHLCNVLSRVHPCLSVTAATTYGQRKPRAFEIKESWHRVAPQQQRLNLQNPSSQQSTTTLEP